MDKEAVTLGLLLATEVALGFSAFEPSPFTARHFAGDKEAQDSIRFGEQLATGFGVVIGTTASVLTKSPIPLIFAILGSVFMIGVYEYCLANPETNQEVMK